MRRAWAVSLQFHPRGRSLLCSGFFPLVPVTVELFRDCLFLLRKISMQKQFLKSFPEQFKYWISPLVAGFVLNVTWVLNKGKSLAEVYGIIEKNEASNFPSAPSICSPLQSRLFSKSPRKGNSQSLFRTSFQCMTLTLKYPSLVCSQTELRSSRIIMVAVSSLLVSWSMMGPNLLYLRL